MDDKTSRVSNLSSNLKLVHSVNEPVLAQPAPSPAQGPDLLNQVVTLTGLPNDLVELELLKILETQGCKEETLTLDELRVALLAYLESMKGDLCDPEKHDDATH